MSAREELAELRAQEALARHRRSRNRRAKARTTARKVARYSLWVTPFGLVNEGGDGGWFK